MNVLVVEDDAAIRSPLAEYLAAEGHQVVTASDGGGALASLRAGFRADVIVLDLMMPGMDGWDFRAAQLSDPLLAPVPVVVLSGAGFSEATISHQLGGARYVAKPLDPPFLEALLVEISGAAAPRPSS
jgi:CheY-like chemotaxis protein